MMGFDPQLWQAARLLLPASYGKKPPVNRRLRKVLDFGCEGSDWTLFREDGKCEDRPVKKDVCQTEHPKVLSIAI
ncbi:MAG: hypothetical protein KBT70_05670 [Roseovarius sp.]|uniref:hypothetical protein n=1 Tax=Roseovarius sp. TaxID=1486281 RepID=UPI001B76C555|nr:hypothetical protein [Roseovarius sp.]MBQ0749672.1 hypothetical protein [Roseovarius sp.]MBQ0809610.1 hypothetical protein [Roseovarius sp.]